MLRPYKSTRSRPICNPEPMEEKQQHQNASTYVDGLVKSFDIDLLGLSDKVLDKAQYAITCLLAEDATNERGQIRNRLVMFLKQGRLGVCLRYLKRLYMEADRKNQGLDWTLGPRTEFPKADLRVKEVQDEALKIQRIRDGLPPESTQVSWRDVPPPSYIEFLIHGIVNDPADDRAFLRRRVGGRGHGGPPLHFPCPRQAAASASPRYGASHARAARDKRRRASHQTHPPDTSGGGRVLLVIEVAPGIYKDIFVYVFHLPLNGSDKESTKSLKVSQNFSHILSSLCTCSGGICSMLRVHSS